MRSEDPHYLESRLCYELVPFPLQGKAPRSLMPHSAWNAIRAYARERSDNRCEICGRKSTKIQSHERYAVSPHVLVLKRIVSVCPLCHLAIHPGFAQAKGQGEKAFTRYAKINDIPVWLAKQDCVKAMEEWRGRISVTQIDWSMLADIPYAKFLPETVRKRAEASFIETGPLLPLAYLPGETKNV